MLFWLVFYIVLSLILFLIILGLVRSKKEFENELLDLKSGLQKKEQKLLDDTKKLQDEYATRVSNIPKYVFPYFLKQKTTFLKNYGKYSMTSKDNDRYFSAKYYKVDFISIEQVNDEKFTATFKAYSRDGIFYTTTLNDCTCEDFKFRRKPCKHMYWLAIHLGVIDCI